MDDKWQLGESHQSSGIPPPVIWRWLNVAAATGAIVVTAITGHASVSGKVASIEQTGGYTVVAVTGHISVTGKTATVLQPIAITTPTGHLTATGKTATIVQPHAVVAVVGHEVLSGKTSAVLQPHTVTAVTGHTLCGGKVATLLQPHTASPTTGHITIGGKIAGVLKSGSIEAITGHLGYSGKVATVLRSQSVVGVTGHTAITGKIATLTKSNGFTAATGHLIASGKIPSISQSAVVAVYPLTGRISFSATPATITIGSAAQNIVAISGACRFTGHASDVFYTADWSSTVLDWGKQETPHLYSRSAYDFTETKSVIEFSCMKTEVLTVITKGDPVAEAISIIPFTIDGSVALFLDGGIVCQL